jgi:DNA repair exonuclease SbcCD ATPase subunit
MIKFIKIKGQGFGSFIQPTKFKLDREGLNIIIAKNGSGKTTIFNLLYWTLYGKALKDIKDISTWNRFRTSDWQGTIGRLEFEKDGVKYEITRCKDYKGKVLNSKGKDRLVILNNGVDISKRNKPDTQIEINNLLGYGADLFKNSILFGQKLKRLTQESGPEKKKVFEEAFESKFIKEGRERAIQKLEILNAEYNQINNKIEVLKEGKLSTLRAYKSLKENKDKQEAIRQRDIKDLQIKLYKLDQSISEYSQIQLKTCQRKLDKAQVEFTSLQNINNEIKDLENQEFRQTNLIDDIEHRIGVQLNVVLGAKEKYTSVIIKCPRCGQKLSPEKIAQEKNNIKKTISEAKLEQKNLELSLTNEKVILKKLLERLDSKKNDKTKIDSLVVSIRKLERELKTHIEGDESHKFDKGSRVKINEDLIYWTNKKSSIDTKPLKLQLKTYKSKIIKLKPRWEELKGQIENLKWAIDDVLGNKGLKAYIFDTMLKDLNELLKYYEQFIGYRIEFNIDFGSANKDIYTICYIDNHPCFYEELSGAQGQLVDIATAFALNDLVTQGRPINIMIFDEVMDNLDEENEDIVYELINNKSLTSSIFLISHNITLQSASTKVIRMSYDKKTGQSIFKML